MGKCGFLLVVAFLLISGCGGEGGSRPKFTEEELALIPLAQKEGLPEASGGFVLAVGGETITSDEITTEPLLEYFRPIAQKSSFQQFKEQAGPKLEQLLATRITNILLYQQAKRDTGVDIEDALEKATEAEVRNFVAGFEGDYAKAEQALKQMRMDWRSFREYQKKMILSQDYIRRQLPEHRPVTYGELVNCYNEMKEEFFAIPATIKFQLLDIEAAKVELNDPNQNQQEKANSLANELLEQIRAGQDMSESAQGLSGVSFVGYNRPTRPESLEKPYDVLAAEAEKIRPGEVAGPIEAGEHIFIIKLEEKKPKSFEPLANVQREVEAKIIFDRRKKAVDEFSAKLVQEAALNERGKFIDFCLKKIYRLSNQSQIPDNR